MRVQILILSENKGSVLMTMDLVTSKDYFISSDVGVSDTWRTSSYRELEEIGLSKDDILLHLVYVDAIRNTNVVVGVLEDKYKKKVRKMRGLYWSEIDRGELLDPYARDYCQDYLNIALKELKSLEE